MFRYVIALLALVGLLSLPVVAQDNDGIKRSGPCAPITKEDVSQLTTFTICAVFYVEKGEPVLSFRANEDGTATCTHVVESGDESFHKVVSTEVTAKLTAPEIKSLRDVFAKLKLDTLKTKKLPEGSVEPPEKFIVINATNGEQTAHYAVETGVRDEYTAKVEPFLAVISKLADRLK